MTRLKYERRARRQSQLGLARAVGLTQPAVSQIERGILVPTSAQLDRLAASFCLPAAELLKEVVVVAAVTR